MCGPKEMAPGRGAEGAFLPTPHTRLGRACQPHNRVGAVPVSRCKHDPRAPDRFGFAVAIRNDRPRPPLSILKIGSEYFADDVS
jgi:hypothetical protein